MFFVCLFFSYFSGKLDIVPSKPEFKFLSSPDALLLEILQVSLTIQKSTLQQTVKFRLDVIMKKKNSRVCQLRDLIVLKTCAFGLLVFES